MSAKARAYTFTSPVQPSTEAEESLLAQVNESVEAQLEQKITEEWEASWVIAAVLVMLENFHIVHSRKMRLFVYYIANFDHDR